MLLHFSCSVRKKFVYADFPQVGPIKYPQGGLNRFLVDTDINVNLQYPRALDQ